ncbi:MULTISPECIES: YlmC/YmxH family sporulation protein [unclassified Clostridium]|uniref:YlmC/YmxH family sporulation protein n=1 Tax=Clostridium TaxID=1485 RepID=UPI000E7E6C7F|nr:YlmC/YmxH family sporulation protein [Clostridium sp.]HBL06412.1 YlmC/YmxH family sporulation protein [Clostridium sp.]
METSMFAINSLKTMEIIDINTGTKLGYIKDFKVNCEEYKLEAIILPTQKSGWFSKNEDIELPWERIKKIGVDVILVDGEGIVENN